MKSYLIIKMLQQQCHSGNPCRDDVILAWLKNFIIRKSYGLVRRIFKFRLVLDEATIIPTIS
jgi:hypothetical protein